MRRILLGVSLVVVVLAMAGTLSYSRITDHRAKGKLALEEGIWEYAREHLDQYLEWFPHDEEARLLLAEAYARDDTLPNQEAPDGALAQLAMIPANSPFHFEARCKEARLQLFVLRDPEKAEDILRAPLEENPDSLEANYLMWKLLDLTGRTHLAAPYFWKTYEASPEQERPFRLREWFLSQFYPTAANQQLTSLMDLTRLESVEDDDARIHWYLHFRRAHPDSPLPHALAARHVLNEYKDAKGAIDILVEAAGNLDNEATEPLFLATLIEAHLAQNHVAAATDIFDQWPEPRDGYTYHLIRGRVLQANQDYNGAIASFERVVDTDWPGPVDLNNRSRLAECLQKQGKSREAAEIRDSLKILDSLLRDEPMAELRLTLDDLNDTEGLMSLVDFYQKLSCQREAEAWRETLDSIEQRKRNDGVSLEIAP